MMGIVLFRLTQFIAPTPRKIGLSYGKVVGFSRLNARSVSNGRKTN